MSKGSKLKKSLLPGPQKWGHFSAEKPVTWEGASPVRATVARACASSSCVCLSSSGRLRNFCPRPPVRKPTFVCATTTIKAVMPAHYVTLRERYSVPGVMLSHHGGFTDYSPRHFRHILSLLKRRHCEGKVHHTLICLHSFRFSCPENTIAACPMFSHHPYSNSLM